MLLKKPKVIEIWIWFVCVYIGGVDFVEPRYVVRWWLEHETIRSSRLPHVVFAQWLVMFDADIPTGTADDNLQ